jgi:hypothetical protein
MTPTAAANLSIFSSKGSALGNSPAEIDQNDLYDRIFRFQSKRMPEQRADLDLTSRTPIDRQGDSFAFASFSGYFFILQKKTPCKKRLPRHYYVNYELLLSFFPPFLWFYSFNKCDEICGFLLALCKIHPKMWFSSVILLNSPKNQ